MDESLAESSSDSKKTISTREKEDSKSRVTHIGLVVSSIALLVAMASAYFSYLNRVDSLTYDTIKNTYSTFIELDKLALSHPDLGHMFTVPSTYAKLCALLASNGKLSKVKSTELYLREWAIANLIFDIFEHALYQWEHSIKTWDSSRETMAKAVLDYLTGRLLRNPRLLYFWSLKGAGLQDYYEAQTKAYYRKHVLEGREDTTLDEMDIFGPYRAVNNNYSPKCIREQITVE